MQLETRRYTAFISYKHSDNAAGDRRWAEWLHRELEQYNIPTSLRGTRNLRGATIPDSLYPVFRDEVELPATTDLEGKISEALEQSNYLVVLCSPRSARSPWVRQEVRRFKELRRAERILAVIIAGEPNSATQDEECFCEELRFGAAAPDGTVDWTLAVTPLAADFRPSGTHDEGFTSADAFEAHLLATSPDNKESVESLVESYRRRLDIGLLKIIAGILDIPLGQLTERDAAYRAEAARKELARAKLEADRLRAFNRRLKIAATTVICLAAIAGWQWKRANDQKEYAEFQESRATVALRRAEVEAAVAIKERNVAESERERASAAQRRAEIETARTSKALDAANAAASGLVHELVTKTENWPGLNTAFRTRLLIRAQFVLLSALAVSEGAQSTELRRSLGVVYSELASTQMESGHFGLAAEAAKAGENMFRHLVAESPTDKRLFRDLSIVLRKKGQILFALDRTDEAEAVFLESLQLAVNAEDAELELAATHTRLGMLKLSRDDSGGAKYDFLKANAALAKLASTSDSVEITRNLAASHLNIAAALDKLTMREEVERHLQETERLYSIIVTRSLDGANDTELMELKMSMHAVYGEFHEARNNHSAAAEAYGAAVLAGLELARANPNNRQWVEKLADHSEHLGLSFLRSDQPSKAADAFDLSVSIWRRLADKFEDDGSARLHLAWSLVQLGRATGSRTETLEEARRILFDLVTDKDENEELATALLRELETMAPSK